MGTQGFRLSWSHLASPSWLLWLTSQAKLVNCQFMLGESREAILAARPFQFSWKHCAHCYCLYPRFLVLECCSYHAIVSFLLWIQTALCWTLCVKHCISSCLLCTRTYSWYSIYASFLILCHFFFFAHGLPCCGTCNCFTCCSVPFQGIHCLLPENRQLVEDLKRRNIHPLVFCIVPNSAKTIVWVFIIITILCTNCGCHYHHDAV